LAPLRLGGRKKRLNSLPAKAPRRKAKMKENKIGKTSSHNFFNPAQRNQPIINIADPPKEESIKNLRVLLIFVVKNIFSCLLSSVFWLLFLKKHVFSISRATPL